MMKLRRFHILKRVDERQTLKVKRGDIKDERREVMQLTDNGQQSTVNGVCLKLRVERVEW